MLRAEIIAIGSELLTPFRSDTNSLFITRSLEENGIRLVAKTIIGDDETELAHAFQVAFSRADIIACSGGLGPTVDDLTREALANFLNVDLELHEDVLETIRARFRDRGMKMPDTNRKQAMVPRGGHILENPLGSAPGLYMEAQGKQVFLLPGPPHELEAMWMNQVLPRLRKDEPLERSIFKIAMLGESRVDEMLREVTRRLVQTQYTILAAAADIEIHLTAPVSIRAEREHAAAQVRQILGKHIYAEELCKLEDVVARLMHNSGKTLSLAESCTGGLVAHRITEIAGASQFFERGVIVYSNSSKSELLGVPPDLIARHGAVSEPVARAMAEGVQRQGKTHFGIGVTGIAGPDGGTAEKPVGTVFVALAEQNRETQVERYNFPGERSRVKFMSSQAALNLLRLRLLEKS